MRARETPPVPQLPPPTQPIIEDDRSSSSGDSTCSADFNLEPGAEGIFDHYGPRYSRKERKVWKKIDELLTPQTSPPVFPPRSSLPRDDCGCVDWPAVLLMPFTRPGSRHYPWTDSELQEMQSISYMDRIRYAMYCHLSPRERQIIESSTDNRQIIFDHALVEKTLELDAKKHQAAKITRGSETAALTNIRHVSGKSHVLADCLSRMPVSPPDHGDFDDIPAYSCEVATTQVLQEVTSAVSDVDMEDMQMRDPDLRELIGAMNDPEGCEPGGEVMRELVMLVGGEQHFTTAYHPQSNDLVERFNSTLGNMLSYYTDSKQQQWDAALQSVLFAYNTSIQASTQYSPFELVYGRMPILPIDQALCSNITTDYVLERKKEIETAREIAKKNILATQDKMKVRFWLLICSIAGIAAVVTTSSEITTQVRLTDEESQIADIKQKIKQTIQILKSNKDSNFREVLQQEDITHSIIMFLLSEVTRLTEVQKKHNVMAACRLRQIPTTIIPPDTLRTDLLNLTSHLTTVPRFTSDSPFGSGCIAKLFRGTTVAELAQQCSFKCESNEGTRMTEIDDEHFVITQPGTGQTNHPYLLFAGVIPQPVAGEDIGAINNNAASLLTAVFTILGATLIILGFCCVMIVVIRILVTRRGCGKQRRQRVSDLANIEENEEAKLTIPNAIKEDKIPYQSQFVIKLVNRSDTPTPARQMAPLLNRAYRSLSVMRARVNNFRDIICIPPPPIRSPQPAHRPPLEEEDAEGYMITH
ncbi:hypothetical protein B566_EDAN006508 [Ephemera danica]|nr:hypothetical protein B566_EDAN006508 [Ephemera danica]